jgi:hypothetical protein
MGVTTLESQIHLIDVGERFLGVEIGLRSTIGANLSVREGDFRDRGRGADHLRQGGRDRGVGDREEIEGHSGAVY